MKRSFNSMHNSLLSPIVSISRGESSCRLALEEFRCGLSREAVVRGILGEA